MRYYNSEVAAYFSDIEDLTHKTGNFKQFTVFVNMLESALAKVSIFIFCTLNYAAHKILFILSTHTFLD